MSEGEVVFVYFLWTLLGIFVSKKLIMKIAIMRGMHNFRMVMFIALTLIFFGPHMDILYERNILFLSKTNSALFSQSIWVKVMALWGLIYMFIFVRSFIKNWKG